MSDINLDEYVDVAERIAAFYEKYPEGSLQRVGDPVLMNPTGDKTFIVYTAAAYRTPDDERPGHGTAWEPVPGPTPFTRDSEIQNAETSAWGRAIASLGFEVRKGIATQQDVRNRSGSNGQSSKPSDKQLDFLASLLKKAGADNVEQLRSWAAENLTGGKEGTTSKTIEALKGEHAAKAVERMQAKASEWAAKQTDVPADSEGLAA